MERKISKNWYMFLIKGIILVVLSLFVLVNPEGTLKTIAFYLGIGLLISGIVLVIRNIPAFKEEGSLNWNIIEAAIDLIVGFLLVIAPSAMVAIIPFLFGLWALLYSILIIVDAFRTKINTGMKLITGTVILIIACVLIFKPLLLGLTIIIWLGILLLAAGILNILLSFRMKDANLIKGAVINEKGPDKTT